MRDVSEATRRMVLQSLGRGRGKCKCHRDCSERRRRRRRMRSNFSRELLVSLPVSSSVPQRSDEMRRKSVQKGQRESQHIEASSKQ